jgi:uncharacterized RmlC-like cupin family protein
MPVLAIGGAKSFGTTMALVMNAAAGNVRGLVIADAGHWLMEEQPKATVAAVRAFLDEAAWRRVTPAEAAELAKTGGGAGTSGVAGIQTTVLAGNPSESGLYTIRLSVPANTRIEAHSHRDTRSATVVSGIWRIGYGSKFDEVALKALPPGSFYTEPAGQSHFAQTGSEPVVVDITGYGPTDTVYAQP